MLDDNGLVVAELDLAWWWLPGAADVHIPPELDDQDLFCFDESALFTIGEAVGARSLNAVDVFGGRFSVEASTEAFASLCDRAADHGLLVHIEFLPWSKIPDLASAWTIVRDAERPNGGMAVDAWHFFANDRNLEVLEEIPGDKVHSIQLSDAPSGPRKDPLLGSLHDRLLPGEGELDLVALLTGLRRIDARAPIGVEVFSDTLHDLEPVEAGRLAGESVRALLAQRPSEIQGRNSRTGVDPGSSRSSCC